MLAGALLGPIVFGTPVMVSPLLFGEILVESGRLFVTVLGRLLKTTSNVFVVPAVQVSDLRPLVSPIVPWLVVVLGTCTGMLRKCEAAVPVNAPNTCVDVNFTI